MALDAARKDDDVWWVCRRPAALPGEHIERLEDEPKALYGDIKDIYAEAKTAGFELALDSVLTEAPQRPGASMS
jgi:hypothetical protein